MEFVKACQILNDGKCEFIRSNLGITYDFCGIRKEIYSRPIPQDKATYPVSPSVNEILGDWSLVNFCGRL